MIATLEGVKKPWYLYHIIKPYSSMLILFITITLSLNNVQHCGLYSRS